ncbi:MAG: TraR/DksA family transcriptional regulator [Gammaproteobacteria bacterium]
MCGEYDLKRRTGGDVMTTHLSSHQLDLIKAKLNDRLVALRKEIASVMKSLDHEQYSEAGDLESDSADEVLPELLLDIELIYVEHHIQEIREIDAALWRIAEGCYGVCADCKIAIVAESLVANPTALRCADCQEVYDRTFTHCGSPV